MQGSVFNYPDILKKWQDKFRYILVDEFQDVNQAQYDVVRMLLNRRIICLWWG